MKDKEDADAWEAVPAESGGAAGAAPEGWAQFSDDNVLGAQDPFAPQPAGGAPPTPPALADDEFSPFWSYTESQGECRSEPAPAQPRQGSVTARPVAEDRLSLRVSATRTLCAQCDHIVGIVWAQCVHSGNCQPGVTAPTALSCCRVVGLISAPPVASSRPPVARAPLWLRVVRWFRSQHKDCARGFSITQHVWSVPNLANTCLIPVVEAKIVAYGECTRRRPTTRYSSQALGGHT
ncbi:hypothetical protein HW555_001737 [Spodoptera exigua]|uniref:Uncharacterized protein n=1 Tax=Spodoptera exigua TaxID=7107 RepID=A0A835GNU5_SPOEX|nr:hypothetical protein HW555_001737 [Spodoptera exigua]